jgi:uncharacterized UPF0160 family protein
MTKTLVTHNSRFHTDDIFACATLELIYPDSKVIRTRDPEIISKGDIVFDVGGKYDPEKNFFDHHQVEGAGERDNGIPYASFGLIWKHFGKDLISNDEVRNRIEKKLVEFVDAIDAKSDGMDLASPKSSLLRPYFLQFAIGSFNPTWNEDENIADAQFQEAVSIAKKVLQREIKYSEDEVLGEQYVREAYGKYENKSILLLDDNYPWGNIISLWPEIMFVVRPNVQNNTWKVEIIRDEPYSYKSRKSLPKEWAGLVGAELAKVTDVPDAVFCHRSYFMAVARSREGALALALKALNS